MADSSSLVQNVKAKNDENVTEKFPYKILNDLAKKLKAAEDKFANMLAVSESNRCDQTKPGNVCAQAEVVPHEASKDVKDDLIRNLKQRISKLTHENNRYHLAISYCTVCAPDVADSEVSSASSVSIKASTPVTISPHTFESCI